ncbi:M24 family metallopeptidase [Thalassobaculum salexigens]|uniref:M24 family metallopeptidase n=1 Tax=Thalassobaculum salexigens TaxID=455360 RepID=UPI00248E8896|nr:Xaa-Pro peptidase family protein [Thalassobaculum salexigens]
MALHFTRAEFDARKTQTLAAMEKAGLDGLLMFRQESMFWLTGYDTFGFCFFQCLYLGSDGRVVLLTRAPDLRQAQNTSTIEDIRIWVDRDGATPADDLREVLAEVGARGKRLGVEYDAYGLNARNGKRLDAALDGFAALEDASELVSLLRLVKSPAELEYVRRAGVLADDALKEAHRLTGPGVDEGEILAAMQGAVFKGGGDYPGNEFIIGSGGDALLCRYFTGRKTLAAQDQLTLEFAGAYRHYHACMMRTIPVGPVPDHQVHMFNACAEALEACKAALRPGRPIGEVFDAHARVMDANGLRHARLNACGYSLGAVFAPIWMDFPMFYHGNPVEAAPGMVFFLHMILMDSDAQLAMSLGETVIVTDGAPERLSAMPLELVTK